MKNVLFFVLWWSVEIISVSAQQAPLLKVIDPHPDNPYQSDKADNVIATDSCYFLVDGLVNAEGKRYQKIIKTSLGAAILDTITLTGPFNDLAIADGGGSCVTHDGYILFTGEWFNPETEKMGAFLIKMDANLNVLWSQYYSNPIGNGNYYGASVVETDDGQHYLLYASAKSTYLLKTDTAGALIWSKVIPDDVPTSINGNMIKTQDGHVLITTYVHVNNNPGSYDYTASMAKVDYEGNLIWRKDVDNYTNSGEQQEPMATLLDNGGFAVMWANDSFPWVPNVTVPNFSSLYIMDSNGVKQREVRFDRYGIRRIFSTITAANGDIIAVGYNYEAYGGEEQGWLFRATPAGDILWERYFSDSLQRPWSPIFFYDMTETSDGHIICIGYIEDSIPGISINVDRNINMAILMTDADGCLVPDCPGGLQYITSAPEAPGLNEPLRWLEVAPNPAQTTLTVRLPDRVQHSAARLQLFDVMGRVVLDQEADGIIGWQELDVQGLSPGFYSLVLKEKSRVVARQKVIIQR